MTRKRWMSAVAALLGVAAAIVMCTVPLYSVTSSSVSSSGGSHAGSSSQTVLQVMGTGYLVVLLAPAVLAAIPLLLRGRAASIAALVAAVLIGGFVVLGIMSIGLFYLPCAVFAIIAAAMPSAAPGSRLTSRR